MSIILTADLHLDDLPKNQDRWNLFPWLIKQVRRTKATHVIICGDLTDSKNRHDAKLVNRIVNTLDQLSQWTTVVFIPGNHDFVTEKHPFFGFLDKLKGVKVIHEPTSFNITGVGDCLFLPCTRNYEKEWADLDFNEYDFVLTHQSYDGCIAENGTKLSGIPPSVFADIKGKVYSGDVHVPQQVSKNIEYIGSPHRIRFGDQFTPRIVLLKAKAHEDLHFPGKARELLVVQKVEEIREKTFEMGSQVKIRYRLRRRDYSDWPKIKKEIKAIVKEKGWELCGLELKTIQVKSREVERKEGNEVSSKPKEILQEFTSRKKLPTGLTQRGQDLLKEVTNA